MSYQDPTNHVVRGRDPLSPAPRPGRFVADRWHVLQLVKDTARATGIGEREIAVLAAHLSVLAKGPVRADQLLISYAQVTGILDRANCMDERRFRRGEARLEALGFITRKLSANGRRYPVRDGKGRVIDAYGIDLRPLFLRIEEMEQTRQSLHDDQLRRAALRSRISARVSAVKRAAQDRLGHVPDALVALGQDIRNLLRRNTLPLAEIARAEAQLDAAETALPQATAAPCPAVQDASEPPVVPDMSAVDAGHSDRHLESPRKRNTDTDAQDDTPPIPVIWRSCPEVAACFPSPPTDAHGVGRNLIDFSGFLGLGQPVVTKALNILGWARLLVALDYMASRIQQIRNPGGYLDRMMRSFLAGEAIAGGRIQPGLSRGFGI